MTQAGKAWPSYPLPASKILVQLHGPDHPLYLSTLPKSSLDPFPPGRSNKRFQQKRPVPVFMQRGLHTIPAYALGIDFSESPSTAKYMAQWKKSHREQFFSEAAGGRRPASRSNDDFEIKSRCCHSSKGQPRIGKAFPPKSPPIYRKQKENPCFIPSGSPKPRPTLVYHPTGPTFGPPVQTTSKAQQETKSAYRPTDSYKTVAQKYEGRDSNFGRFGTSLLGRYGR